MSPSTQAPAAAFDDDPSSPEPARAMPVARPRRSWRRIVGSFVLVFGVYWFYALAIVPFIEPTIEPLPDLSDQPLALAGARDVVEMQLQALTPWFRTGDWELKSPKVFESPRAKLLLHSYETLPDGRLKIHPCTMIFLSDDPAASEEERNRKAIILQAPDGAILKFATPVNLKQMKIDKLMGGTLMGPITIRSDQNFPGPQDDLLITTRDAELISDRIVTAHPVDFRLGPNRGSGRDLEIQLIPSNKSTPNSPAPGFDGIRSLTLKHDVRMRLMPGEADMFPGAGGKPAAKINRPAGGAAEGGSENPPVDITCDDTFHFDLLRYVATFQKHVDVLRINPDGRNDQLTCELLSVYFEPVGAMAAGAAAGAQPRRDFPKLEPSRIEAEGNPVVLRSPSRGLQSHGTRMEYDLKKNAGSLRGPGWMKAVRPDDARGATMVATWKDILEFGPVDGVQTVKLLGEAHVESVGVGLMNADKIFLFLTEEVDPTAGPKARPRLVPDRLQAVDRVHFESATLSGDVHHLQVWFKQEPRAPAVAAVAGNQPAGNANAPSPAPAPPTSPAPLAGNVAAAATGPREPPAQHMHLMGDLLQVETLMREKATEVTRVHVEGNVHLRETKTADPQVRPLVVKGDRVDIEQPLPEQTLVHVIGRWAHIEAREMSVDGADIHLDRGRNLAWVNGQGLMTFLVTSDLSNQPVAQPRPLEISWKGRMDFDGQVATFQDGIVALMQQQRLSPTGVVVAEQQRLTSNVLQALFEPRIVFAEMKPQSRPQISEVRCHGNVNLEQSTSESGRPIARERMQAIELTAHPMTGDLAARGPGWVRRVWVDTGHGGLPKMPGAQTVSAKPPLPGGAARLAYLGVNFQDRMVGNQTQQTMDFHERVRCVYGQVPDWDTILEPDDPDKLGDGGVLLTSKRLQVVRGAAVPGQERPSFEMTATGNARLEGKSSGASPAAAQPGAAPHKNKPQLFSASAARLTYVEAKDLLVLEGDGRNYAYLARQEHVGGKKDEQSAGKFLFWPSTNQLQVQDAHELNLQNLGNPEANSRRQPAAPSAAPALK